MPSRWPALPHLRAIIGVVALYALVAQVFLAAATPALRFDQIGVLCADHTAGTPSDGQPVRHDHPCCMAVHAGTIAPPVSVSVLNWTPPRSRLVHRRPEAAIPKTGPPVQAQSARGPPLA